MERYMPQKIEKKWQKIWEEKNTYHIPDKSDKKKYYCLVMFPYSSGDLHIGHWYNFTPADAYARYKRMNGFNVLHPIGFDSFGLPAENAAIKRSAHPQVWTEENIQRMTEQLKTTGNSYDWSRMIVTSRSDYYKWTQYMFLQMYKRGLAYRAKKIANWCPDCQTVLANEQVEGGHCWRCGKVVIQKEIEQWMFRITEYADRLLNDLKKLDWPEKTITMQRNWIGLSEGLELDFSLEGYKDVIKVFTTRADTIFGVTFIVLAPEHPIVRQLADSNSKFKIQNSKIKEIQEYVKRSKSKSELERKENKEKSGVFTGLYAINPLNNEKVPVYISDYVLMGYGTGAIMGVPAHDARDFEFAQTFNLEIREVVIPKISQSSQMTNRGNIKDAKKAVLFEDYGTLVNSGKYTGMESKEAIQKITLYVKSIQSGSVKVNYHLRDWVVSRQRYWGPPIPIVYCKKCGLVPVPESELPVKLPFDVDYTPKGTSPLGSSKEFVKTLCPVCKSSARRETDTMDTFVDSTWYFLRFPNPRLDDKPFSKELVNHWLPVDMYIGGAEHTVLHLLYSRFFTKVLFDSGLINFDEPFTRLRHQGIILGPDGYKMSKSRGNIVNPDNLVVTYGSDTVRLYLAFMGPYNQGGPWNYNGIEGIYRFLNRVWTLALNTQASPEKELDKDRLRFMHKTIKKVTEDIEMLHFNTAVSSLMKWLNYLQDQKNVSLKEIQTYLFLLAPFAPHITEELWSKLGKTFSIHLEKWPKYEEKHLTEEKVIIAVQVNGKLRDRFDAEPNLSKDKAGETAKSLANVRKHLEGKKIGNLVYIPNKLINFVTD